MLELRKMQYFVTVAEKLSYSKAAAELHISPPPLSRRIRDLEDEIGAPLLVRIGRSIQLTETGRAFLGEARATLARADQGLTLARLVARGHAGRLRIGYNTVATLGALPNLVRDFRVARPNVDLSLYYLRTQEQLLALSHGDLEVGFLCSPASLDDYLVHEIFREPLVVIVPEGHALARLPEVSFDALSNEPLILYSRVLAPHLFQRIRQEFERAEAIMNIVEELDTYLAIVSFVAPIKACCIVPECIRTRVPPGVVCKPLVCSPIVCSVVAVTKRTRTVLADAFFQFAVRSIPAPASAQEVPVALGRGHHDSRE